MARADIISRDGTRAEGKGEYYNIKPVAAKGNGAFALKTIQPGTRILVEDALLLIDLPSVQVSEQDIQHAFSQLNPAAQIQFKSLPIDDSCPSNRHDKLSIRYFSNNFTIKGSDRQGCFAHASRFNHSCVPNCAMTTTNSHQLQCYVLSEVKPGEELTFSYLESLQYMTWEERTSLFKSGKCAYMTCACQLCTLPVTARTLSDMRRKLMRHLLYIIWRQDLTMVPPTVPEAFQARYASIERPGNNEFLLFVCLAEAEGVPHGLRVRMAYMGAAHAVLQWAVTSNRGVLPRPLLDGAKKWTNRALELKTLCMGAGNYLAEPQDASIKPFCDLIAKIGPDGKVP